jgi:hypothetical protein
MRRLLFTLVLLSVRAAAEPAMMSQAPGSAWVLAPTPERTVRTLYWQLFDSTEIWTRIAPKAPDASRPLPLNLIFSATFKGKVVTGQEPGARPEITILAQPHPLAALPIPNLSFTVVPDDGRHFDLIANGMASRVPSLGDNCCSDAIVARIDDALLLALVKSKKITGHVLGFDYVLDRDDTDALAKFGSLVLRHP